MRGRLAYRVAIAVAVLIAAGAIWERLGRAEVRPLPYRVVDAGRVELGAPIGKRIRLQKTMDAIVGPGRVIIPPGRVGVVISPGPRSSSGYSVRILSVTDERRRVVVRVREETPTLGERVRPVVTYPYRVILIPDTHKRVVVQWQGR